MITKMEPWLDFAACFCNFMKETKCKQCDVFVITCENISENDKRLTNTVLETHTRIPILHLLAEFNANFQLSGRFCKIFLRKVIYWCKLLIWCTSMVSPPDIDLFVFFFFFLSFLANIGLNCLIWCKSMVLPDFD
jgi:hypothetical protein